MVNQKQKTKITKSLETITRVIKKGSIGVGIVLALIVTAYGFYNVSAWYDNNRVVFQVPAIDVTVYWPVVIEDRKIQKVSGKKILSPLPDPTVAPEITPQKTSKLSKGDMVAHSKYPAFIDHVWLRESGRGEATEGLNASCNNKGGSNDFGFAVAENYCFTDFEEGVKMLELWVDNRKGKYTENQLKCLYNTGTATESCFYLTLDFANMN